MTGTTTRWADLSSEVRNLSDRMESLSIRVSRSLEPTIPAANRAAHAALFARYAEVRAEMDEIARREAYSLDNEAAITGCHNDRLLSANLPALDSLDDR